MIPRIVSLFLLLAVVCGCENEPLPSQNKAGEVVLQGDEVFINPEFECPTGDVVEPGEGYPHPFKVFPHSPPGERTIAQLEGFCERMRERFSESGLTVTEAGRVFEAIPTVLNIKDGSYGMPGPGNPQLPPVDLETRVMLKKIAADRYELFFYQIGCGRHYLLYELDLTGGEAKARQIESWSENYPC